MGTNSVWYVAQTHAGKERTASEHLSRQGFEVFFPKLRPNGQSNSVVKKKIAPRPLFPGYIFISFDPRKVRWQAIDSTIGVIRLVRFGDAPARLEPGLVERMIELSALGHLAFQESLAPNDKVRILAGPFDNWIGHVVSLSKGDRAIVLLQMASRSVSVEMGKEDLIRAA